MPTYLHDRFGLSLGNAGFSSVFYNNLFAVIGVLLGGRLSDRISRKRVQFRMEIEYLSLLIGAPFFYWMGVSGSLPVMIVALSGLGLFRGIYDSNLFAALFDVIEPKYRSSATGFMLSIGFIISSLSPVFLGWIKERSDLSFGFSILGLAFILSAVVVFVNMKVFFKRDLIREESF
jgi:MFS family permease